MSAAGSSVISGASRWLAARAGVPPTASASPAAAMLRRTVQWFIKGILHPSSVFASVRVGAPSPTPTSHASRPDCGRLGEPGRTCATRRTDPIGGARSYMASGKKKTVTAGHSVAEHRAPTGDLAVLIERTANGEESALAALYDRTAAMVNGLALRILGDRSAAEEVTGDVYLQVWRQAERYNAGRGAPLAWLLTLARTRAIDRRRTSARQHTETAPIRAALRVASDAPGPEERSAVRQRRQVVRKALTGLPADQRRTLELAYFDGLSHSEI